MHVDPLFPSSFTPLFVGIPQKPQLGSAFKGSLRCFTLPNRSSPRTSSIPDFGASGQDTLREQHEVQDAVHIVE